jgi:hypothetical protein
LPRRTKRERHAGNNYLNADRTRMDQVESNESSHPISRTRCRHVALDRRLLAQPPLLLNAEMLRLRTVKPKRRIPHSDSPFSKGLQPGCTTNTEADNKKMPI